MSTNYLTTQQSTPNFERLFPLYELQAIKPEAIKDQGQTYEALRDSVDYEAIEKMAWQLIADHSRPEKSLAFHEAEDNARTALFEALTESGHLSRIEFDGDIEIVHAQIVERLLNGYDQTLPSHELWRRFKELCEELAAQEVFRKIVAGHAPENTQINTISDFPVVLGVDANKLGYRYANKKGMVRSTFLIRGDDGHYTRVIEQISRSNSDPYESAMALHDMGITIHRSQELDIDLLGTQFTGTATDAEKGVIGLMRRLDAFSGPDIRYGEVNYMGTISYDRVARVSYEREKRVEHFVKRLAECEKKLDTLKKTGVISQVEWMQQYGEEVRECVRQICIIHPQYVEKVLGGGAVKEAYLKAHEQYMAGDFSGAAETTGAVASQEASLVICGSEISSNPQFNNPNNTINKMKKELKESKENWKWTKGLCQVNLCAFQRETTDVGPCSVCATCQGYFDDGKNPTNIYRRQQLAEASNASRMAVINDEKPVVSKEANIQNIYGDYAQSYTKITVGGTKEVVLDTRNGYELVA